VVEKSVFIYNAHMRKPLVILASVALFGCAQDMERKLDTVRRDFSAGNFSAQVVGDDNLDPLLRGNALFQENRFGESDKEFERINARMADAQSGGLLSEAGKAAAGAMSAEYKPYFMDDLMVSYYQLWAALADGRVSDARVIINQSYDKQKRLSEEYAKLLGSREKERGGIAAKMRKENAQWESYKDIMNPALTYLSGIYFMNFAQNASDFDTARLYLARADGMAPENKCIKEDLSYAKSGRAPSGVAWVFIESGFAPKLKERRTDWPVYSNNGVHYVSVAVSAPVVFVDMPRVAGSELISNVDAMFMTEFKEYSVNQALRVFASVAAKAALQGAADKYGGALGGLVAAAASVAMTSAEVRTWATLPKKVYVIRHDKKKGKDELISIKIGDRILSNIKVDRAGNDLIYIRMTGERIEPKIIKLK